MLNPVEWPLVANITRRIFVLDAFSSPPSHQMLILNNIPNRLWTYINHNNPFEDKFKAWWQPKMADFIFLVCQIFQVQLVNNATICRISDSAMLVIFLCFLYDVPLSGKSGSLFEGSISTDGNVSILFPLQNYYIDLNVALPWLFDFSFLSTRMRQLSNFHTSHS